MKKVLLMTPPYHCGVVESAGRWMPLPLVNLAGALRARGYDAAVYDAMSKFHGYGKIRARILEAAPDYIGLTACTPTVNECLKVARLAKKLLPEVKTVFGGVHPTFRAEELFENDGDCVDYVVRREGEETLPELLDALESGRGAGGVHGVSYCEQGATFHNPPRPYLSDLDSVEPAWDLLDWEDYKYYVIPKSRLAVVNSSRGCDNECSFCSQQKFWERTWRARRPEAFVAEIRGLHDTYGANVFLICDEFPTRDRARWEEILDRLIAESPPIYLLMETCVRDILRDENIMGKYHKAGIVHIYIGVEATSQEALDDFKKNINVEESREAIRIINDAGMITETSFILGAPRETPASIRETLRLANFYNPDFAHFLALTPWPYADSYAELAPHIEVFDYSKYNLVEPVIRPEKMTLNQVNREIFNCYRKFYMRKLTEIEGMADSFKRAYLLSSMKAMMKSSFLTKNLNLLGGMPDKVAKMMRNNAKNRGGSDL